MSEAVIKEVFSVKQNENYCSSCAICSTLCPYEALTKDPETGKIFLEIEKCQVCGLCYSTCPAKAIDTIYYDTASLARYLDNARQKYASDNLVIMCRGSAPDFATVGKMFELSDFIPMSVPCVGRIPDEILFHAISKGIKKLYILACDEDYCRYQRGSSVAIRKVHALNRILEQLGYGKDVIVFQQNSLKVKVDTDLCIACGNCVYFCPYNAASLTGRGSVSFDLSLCRGCGLCVAMCPALALDLENWEKQQISALITKTVPELASPKMLVFRCQWAAFPSLEDEEVAANTGIIDLPCASRMDVSHILEAFLAGIDGVLIAACDEDDCKQEKASGKAQHSIEKFTDKLSQINLQDRLRFCTVAPRNPDKFVGEIEQFSQDLKAMVT